MEIKLQNSHLIVGESSMVPRTSDSQVNCVLQSPLELNS